MQYNSIFCDNIVTNILSNNSVYAERAPDLTKTKKIDLQKNITPCYNSFTGNIIPHSWYKTFLTESGRSDTTLISILSEIFYWYRPSKAGGSKFTSDAWQTSYDHFTSKFCYSRETVRRVFVKLEEFGVAYRDIRMIKSYGHKYNNVLFIRLNHEKLLSLTEGVKPKNDSVDKIFYTYDRKLYTPSPQNIGDHIEEEIKYKNNLKRSDKNKSDSVNSNNLNSIHLLKTTLANKKIGQGDSKNSFDSEANSVIALKPIASESITLEPQSNTHTTSFQNLAYLPNSLKNITINTLKNTAASTINLEHDSELISEKPSDIPNFTYILNNSHNATTANNPNTNTTYTAKTPNHLSNTAATNCTGDLRKPLSFFYPLNEEDAIYLRKSSGRAFSLNFINKLLLKLSAKFPKDGAYTKFQLLSKYLTSRLMYEKTDPELGNQENFTFRPIEGTQEHINRQKYKFLTAIENSLNTNPSTLIKQKIIGFSSGDSNYAYHTITNCKLPYINSSDIKHLNITELLKNCEADALKQNSFNNNNTYAGATKTSCLNIDNSSNKTYSSTLKTLEIKISNEITEAQKSIIAKAVNEVLSYSTNISFKVSETAFLKPEVELIDKSTLNNSNTAQKSLNQLESSEPFEIKPETPSSPLWKKIRQILSKRHGEATDISWFSKLDIEVKTADDKSSSHDNDQNNMQNHIQGSIQDNIRSRDSTQSTALAKNQIIIKAPTAFMRDWIKSNYESSIEDAIKILIEREQKESYDQNSNLLESISKTSLNQGLKAGLSIICAN